MAEMRKIISVFIVVYILTALSTVFLCAAPEDIMSEYSKRKKKYKELEKKYWESKNTMLNERALTEERLENIDNEVRTLYLKKNNIMEEIYLKKDNLRSLGEKYDDMKDREHAISTALSDALEREGKKIMHMFPSLMEAFTLRLNTLKKYIGEGSGTRHAISGLIGYRRSLLDESENMEIYNTTLLHPEEKKPVSVQCIRLGFIFNAFSSEGYTGILLPSPSTDGIYYEWQWDISMRLASAMNRVIGEAFNNMNDQDKKLLVPVDAAQAGKKIKSVRAKETSGFFYGVYSYFRSGGIIMYPLLFVALFALLIIIERLVFFRRNSTRVDHIINKIIESLKKNKRDEAVRISKEMDSPITRIIYPLIDKKVINRKTAEQVLDEMMIQEVPLLSKRLSTLAVLGAIAPLLGLLGTVSGMIKLFDVITLYGTSNPKVLAGGISIALVTTQTGLSLAIPIMLVHHLLMRKKNSILAAIEKHTIRILNQFFPGKK
ncbi:MotA/TolQ/ExbB proton channel family protein [Spirochaetota bacterium]